MRFDDVKSKNAEGGCLGAFGSLRELRMTSLASLRAVSSLETADRIQHFVGCLTTRVSMVFLCAGRSRGGELPEKGVVEVLGDGNVL